MEVDLTQLNEGKSFKVELSINKENVYLINFILGSSLEIEANQINDIIKKSFSNKFSLQKIRENKYFLQFDSLKEIFDELKERINNNKITIEENENNLKIIIQLPSSKNKEIIFELNPINKNDSEKIQDLTQLVLKQNKEICDLKNKIIKLETKDMQLNKELNDLEEKMNILWGKEIIERKQIWTSKIIGWNIDYIERIKLWINPSKKIKTELLYRLSENGDKFSTFHELCDNKGPTLTLFHVNDGNKVGIYTPLSWDSNSEWKMDMDTFVFNINTNKQFKKIKSDLSIYCHSSFGPYTADFGCFRNNSMKLLKHYGNEMNTFYINGSEILPSNFEEKDYDLLETEVYKVIIE